MTTSKKIFGIIATMIALIMVVFLFLMGAANASQNSTTLPTTSPYPGLTMLSNINSAFDTFQTNFSGASSPSGAKTDQCWADTSTSILRFYDGTNFLPMGKWSGSQWAAISNGVPFTIPASTGSTNAYVVTYAPVPTALVSGQHYPFIANFSNTSTATENVNSLGAKAITKQGAVALASGDITNGAVVDTVYDGTRFQITSQIANTASGSVTSVATNNGLTGGPITGSGTIGLATIGSSTALANITGSSAVPTATALTAIQTAPAVTVLASGTGTYTTPANTSYIRVRMIGGGGGGGGAGVSATSGSAGGTTTLGSTVVTAPGGNGGQGANSSGGGTFSGGLPPSAGTGTIAIAGSGGGSSGSSGTGAASIAVGGIGGSGAFGGGGTGGDFTNNPTGGSGSIGGGGGGASFNNGSANFGGGGGSSGAYTESIITSPSSTYAYSVGAAGSFGTGANNGGAGGAGIIIIEAY